MENPALAKKLEGYIISLPVGYSMKILDISASSGLREFAGAIVHNIDAVDSASRGRLNVMHIMGVFIAIVAKMQQGGFPNNMIVSALDIFPKYLEIILTDERMKQDAISFINGETDDIRNRLK